MTLATTTTPEAINSAQLLDNGEPRFRIPARPDHAGWHDAAYVEANGGVHADVRVFMDEQIETGDVVLDVAPGFGFVSLGAATAPGGLATVLVNGFSEAELTPLQDAAADAGAWIEPLDAQSPSELETLIEARLGHEGRLLLHADAESVIGWCEKIAQAGSTSRVLAVCVSGKMPPEKWFAVRQALGGLELTACALAEKDGAAMLIPIDGLPNSAILAVPAVLFSGEAPTEHTASNQQNVEMVREHLDVDAAVSTAVRSANGRWVAARDGLSFIAPHSRTGYGVTGAHLLRALQAQSVPVAFFPLGPVDPALTSNPMLPVALESQASFNASAPSIRLSQQFDLALHAGNGPRIGFTIFETEQFTARELHHLRQQDLVITCSPWGAEVCRTNGLSDVPVHVVPLGVDMSVFHDKVVPSHNWDETVFLQVGKLESRKGQRELLRAFEAAFTPNDNVRLVLACHNPFIKREQFDAAAQPFRASPMSRRITIIPSELATSHDVAALMSAADCGVFPVRAEGWNLEALEMMAMGKRIIATYATAHTAYMTEENAQLILLGEPESAIAGNFSGTWGSWGDAQHDALVESLRTIHSAKRTGCMAPNVAGISTAQFHSWDASATALLEAIATVA